MLCETNAVHAAGARSQLAGHPGARAAGLQPLLASSSFLHPLCPIRPFGCPLPQSTKKRRESADQTCGRKNVWDMVAPWGQMRRDAFQNSAACSRMDCSDSR